MNAPRRSALCSAVLAALALAAQAQPVAPVPCDCEPRDARGLRHEPLEDARLLGAGNSSLPPPVTASPLPGLLRATALPDGGRLVVEVERDNLPADGVTLVPVNIKLYGRDGTPWKGATEVILRTSLGRLRLPGASMLEPPRAELRVGVNGGEATVFLVTTHEPGIALLSAQSGNVAVEGRVTMLPDKRPMIAIGVVEGSFNLRSIDATRLAQPRTNDVFELEMRRLHPFGLSSDGKTELGARSAFSLKGTLRNGDLLTLAYDSDKEVRGRQFRDIQPDQFYPITGDSGLRGFDAQSSQRLYARVDRDRSYLLYGDFSTASTSPARQLGSYGRTITGLKQHIENDRVAANVWVTRDNVSRIVDEQPARGISGPYALSSNAGISGSEKVELVTRDRNQPAVILKTVAMARFTDYEFEPFSGNILFKSPVPSVDENLNPVSVRVTYEVETGGPKFWIGGADGQLKLGSAVEVGASIVDDRNPADPYRLGSLNATVRLGDNTVAVGEAARSTRELLGDRGRGDGRRFELRHKDERLEARVYHGETDTTFSNLSSQLNGGRVESGAVGTWKFDERFSLRLDATHSEDRVSLARRDAAYGGLAWRASDMWTFGIGYRHVRSEGGAVNAASAGAFGIPTQPGFTQTQISAPLLAAQPGQVLSFDAVSVSASAQVNDRTRLFGEYEQDVERTSRNRTSLGGEYRINEQYRAYGRAEVANGLGGPNGLAVADARQSALVAGVSGNVTRTSELFNEYRLRDAINGRDAMNATGLRNTFAVREGVRVTASAEHLEAISGTAVSANALTGGIEFTHDPRWRGSGRLEWRQDTNYDNWLSTLAYTAKLNRDWSLLARNQLLINDPRNGTVAGRTQERFQVGGAYRQTDVNRVNALTLYEARYEKITPADGTAGFYERASHVVSLHGDYHPSRPLWLTGRVAGKIVRETFDGGVSSNYSAFLIGGRVVRDISEKWNVGAQGNLMVSPQGGTRQSAVGVEAGYLIRQNLWVTAGYNWSGFSDRELQGAGYTNRGFYVRLRFKFDETLFAGDDPAVNRALAPRG
jgi:hypothetical protein